MSDGRGGTGRGLGLRLAVLMVVLFLWVLLPGQGGGAQAVAPEGSGPAWEVACIVCGHGFDRFSPRAAAADGAGTVHVVYGGRQLYHAWQEGEGPWQVEVVDPAYNTGLVATLALDGAGRPHILYWDAGSTVLKYVWYNGVNWAPEFVPSAPVLLLGAPEAQMAVDGLGQAHVVFVAGSTLYYGLRAPGGWQWQSLDTKAGARASIALDGAGHPHIAYQSGGKLGYKTYDGLTWLTHVFADPPSAGAYPSIAVDDAGNVHIVTRGSGYGPDDRAGLFYFYGESSGWQLEVVAEDFGDSWDFDYHGVFNSLRLDGDGVPHVTYGRWYGCGTPYCAPSQVVDHAWRTTTGWTVEEVGSIGPAEPFVSEPELRSSLALRPNGEPQVFYVTYGELRSAQPGGAPWPYTAVDRNSSAGASQLALDGKGEAYVAYRDTASGGLWYAVEEGETWVRSRLTSTFVGDHFAFSVGPSGVAHLLYMEEWRFGQYLAHLQGGTNGWLHDSWIGSGWSYDLDTFDVTVSDAGMAHISYARYSGLIGYNRQGDGGWLGPQVVDEPAVVGQTLIALDGETRPHVIYARGESEDGPADELVDAVGEGGAWTKTVIEQMPGARYRLEDLVRDRNGRLHLAYVVEGSYVGGNLLRYASLDETGWHQQTLVGDVGDVSLTVDAGGEVHLTFYRLGQLTYVIKTDEGWVVRLQLDAGALGQVSDVAAVNLLTPRITFYDPALGALKLLTQDPSEFVLLPRVGP